MENIIEIPEGYEARIEGNKVILELKEGEDERIRKELVEYFINTGCNSIRGVPIKNVIAYLEKQKERKPAEPDWCHHKVDLSGCSEEYMKAYYDGWNNCNQQHAQRKAEQRSAEWSEEDEIRLKEAIEVLDESIKYLPMGYGFIKDVNLVKNWLKSLRPQPQWKPSEEQMEWLESAVKLSTDKPGIHGIILSLYEQLKRL